MSVTGSVLLSVKILTPYLPHFCRHFCRHPETQVIVVRAEALLPYMATEAIIIMPEEDLQLR